MCVVVAFLNGASARRFVDTDLHRAGDGVGVHDDPAVLVSRGSADRLDERGCGAQKALLVRVENGDERDLGNVKSLAKQIDADENIEDAHTQVTDDLLPLHRFDGVVDILDLDALLGKVVGEILRHLDGKGGDEHLFPFCRDLADLADQVVHLSFDRAHLDLGVKQSRRANDLLGGVGGVLLLILSGRGTDKNGLVDMLLKLIEEERAIIRRRGQAEAVFN